LHKTLGTTYARTYQEARS